MSAGRHASAPARRAVVRWAWRMFRREWRQQLLVLSLVTLAVAASVATAATAMGATGARDHGFGTAQARALLDGDDATEVSRAIAALRAEHGEVEVIGHRAVAVPGVAAPLDVRSQDPDGPFGHPMLALLDGRYPSGPGEVAVTDGAADLLGGDTGDVVELDGRRVRVVGRVEDPTDLRTDFALVAADGPPAASPATRVIALFDLDGGAGEPQQVDGGSQEVGRGPGIAIEARGGEGPVAALVLVAVTLVLSLTGLVAAAGFVAIAHRRRRQLGLLGAIGASERHLRLVVAADGLIVGLVAAVVGGVLGLVGWWVGAPSLEAAIGWRVDRFDLPWGLLAACLVLAVAVSTFAAWWPARAVARVPVVRALSGRPSPPVPVHRSLLVAVVALGLGAWGLVVATPEGGRVRPLLLIASVLAVVVGVVFVVPAALRTLGGPARVLPFAPRLALRDLVRHQARAGAALAAITLALGIAVSVVVLAAADVPGPDQGNLSDRQVLIHIVGPDTRPDPSRTPSDLRRLDDAADEVAAALGAPAAPIDAVLPSGGGAAREPILVAAAPDPFTVEILGPPVVATPELVAALGIDADRIDDDTELLAPDDGPLALIDAAVRADGGDDAVRSQAFDLGDHDATPHWLVMPQAVEARGWSTARTGWFVGSSAPITADRLAAARRVAAASGLSVEVRAGSDDLDALARGATTTGGAVALAIVAMAVGLIRTESAGDLQTLTATGASGRTRRSLTGATAAALALLGALLGTGGAYAAVAAGHHADLEVLVPVPWANLLAVLVGLPLLAGAAGWLLAGRAPRGLARQPGA